MKPSPFSAQRHGTMRQHVIEAHLHVRRAQELAYHSERRAPWRVGLALNRAQSTLLMLLVRTRV